MRYKLLLVYILLLVDFELVPSDFELFHRDLWFPNLKLFTICLFIAVCWPLSEEERTDEKAKACNQGKCQTCYINTEGKRERRDGIGWLGKDHRRLSWILHDLCSAPEIPRYLIVAWASAMSHWGEATCLCSQMWDMEPVLQTGFNCSCQRWFCNLTHPSIRAAARSLWPDHKTLSHRPPWLSHRSPRKPTTETCLYNFGFL